MSGPKAFSMQGHVRRQRGLAVQKIGERGAAHFQMSAAFDTLRLKASMTSVLISSPGGHP
jgi:hypothetical protein